ncbi:hypothetical protein E2C01_013247 [Portunus trituberculatus]|uniref:Uncharacterized protein n=1 Tax=Portunus trituberculatus TaxID=210409 RepID=A0A5B7DGK7_PORTR|nr:hypothetical protein [Portunus trituberculatus]
MKGGEEEQERQELGEATQTCVSFLVRFVNWQLLPEAPNMLWPQAKPWKVTVPAGSDQGTLPLSSPSSF